jgi:hypothetical protein
MVGLLPKTREHDPGCTMDINWFWFYFAATLLIKKKYPFSNRVGSDSRRCPPTPPGILNRTTAVSTNF